MSKNKNNILIPKFITLNVSYYFRKLSELLIIFLRKQFTIKKVAFFPAPSYKNKNQEKVSTRDQVNPNFKFLFKTECFTNSLERKATFNFLPVIFSLISIVPAFIIIILSHFFNPCSIGLFSLIQSYLFFFFISSNFITMSQDSLYECSDPVKGELGCCTCSYTTFYKSDMLQHLARHQEPATTEPSNPIYSSKSSPEKTEKISIEDPTVSQLVFHGDSVYPVIHLLDEFVVGEPAEDGMTSIQVIF